MRWKLRMTAKYGWHSVVLPHPREALPSFWPPGKAEATRKGCVATSYLVGDVLFGCNDLVHVGSQPGVQRDSPGFARVHQLSVLAGGVTQHLPVHRIRDLRGEKRSVMFIWVLFSSLPPPRVRLRELTSIQLLCFCCIFPFRRGPIVSLRSEWRVSMTRLAKTCTEKTVMAPFVQSYFCTSWFSWWKQKRFYSFSQSYQNCVISATVSPLV